MMKQNANKRMRITDTTLRDAHQSLWATRMRTDDILKIASEIDEAGYYSLECWGGATFDVCMRFLRENPWERLRQIKKACPKTPLQMLLRGQNILGYRHYPDDVVDRFVALACENGMDIFRVFDALNDPRNLEQAIKSVKKYGGHAQGTICYTTSPVHTVEAYVKLAKEQEANFCAVLSSLEYGDPEYCYSACLLAYTHLGNALYQADRTTWSGVYSSLSEEVLTDFAANREYWKQFDTPVRKAYNTVYENFLYSFDQSYGLRSYGKCVDLLVHYYIDDARELLANPRITD